MNKNKDLLLTRQEWITIITPVLVARIRENIENQKKFLKKEVESLQEKLDKITIKTTVESKVDKNLVHEVNYGSKIKPVDVTFETDWHSLPSHKLMQQPERIQLKVKEIINKINSLIDKYPYTCIRKFDRELNHFNLSTGTMTILWKQHIEGQIEIKDNSIDTRNKITDKLFIPALEYILPKL